MPNTDSDSPALVALDAVPTLVGMLGGLRNGGRHVSHGLKRAVDLFTVEFGREEKLSRPFLTVVMRTQGRRPEAFKDSLLCLAGQSTDDFEVIVVTHAAGAEAHAQVESIVAAQPKSFRDRVSVFSVSGGLRAKPLNAALEKAAGRYVAFFDDDDLLFGHWVESFARAAERAPGKLVRAVVASQRAAVEMWPQDQAGFRHLNWPNAEYPAHFDQFAHLTMNYSPFMGWAFPREVFEVLGLRFDEELYVCEDWDLILRSSLLCGVEQVDELTAIYRRWEGIESSYTVHDEMQWEASQARVIAKLNQQPIIVPPGSVAAVRSLTADRHELIRLKAELHALLASRSWRYSRPLREAMRTAAFGRRAARGVTRRLKRLWPWR